MPAHVPARSRSRRELLLDGATVLLGGVLILVTTTGLNRLPYPGSQHYARRVAVILTAPSSVVFPEVVSALDGDTDDVAE